MEILLNDRGDGAEFNLLNGDLQSDDTFFTALYVSLFGGDCFSNVYEKYKQDGSFEESLNLTITSTNLKTVQAEAKKALKWLIEEDIAESVDVFAYGNISEKINVDITITEPSGESYQYSVYWDNGRPLLKNI